ncbi:uncharacterized protein LOC127810008 [Diospyros lotus]|uniref:uncharacterized protein LOC127810008 n=1 Tax=Diospyros lotus TaxID=55363 RepID=UPI0022537CBE|nr:uncharacterized protein LOC127810008 [Diospyros lotus]
MGEKASAISISASTGVAEEQDRRPRPRPRPRREQEGRNSSLRVGKTCHQCRQKITNIFGSCKNHKKDRPCTMKFCRKCLFNRYGEKAEEMVALEDWSCPKCRGICNCSVCMKKRGHQPTGILVHTAKAEGFSSVSELLHVKGPESFGRANIVKAVDGNQEDDEILLKESNPKAKRQRISKEGLIEIQDGNRGTRSSLKETKCIGEDISLPEGTELITVAGIDLPPRDVGYGLQFLEFCAAFQEILVLKEGEPVYLLQELIHGGRGCQGKYSPVVQFHIKLLSLILEDLSGDSSKITSKHGKDSWLHVLRNCIFRSHFAWEKLKLEGFGWEAEDYSSLDSSKRLRILAFLCDEILCTKKIRNWIDDQNSNFFEKIKAAKERVRAAKHKEEELKQKMQDEVCKAIISHNGAPLSVAENEASVSRFKIEAAQAHAELLELKDMVPNEDERSDSLRTEPILLGIAGHKYWKLKGSSDNPTILLQDVRTKDSDESGDKWFTFDVEQEKEIQKSISSLRKRRSGKNS